MDCQVFECSVVVWKCGGVVKCVMVCGAVRSVIWCVEVAAIQGGGRARSGGGDGYEGEGYAREREVTDVGRL